MINSIILVGRLTKNIEIRFTSNEKAVGNFTIALNRKFKNQNGEYETDFIDCVIFGKQAETMAQYTKKGDLIGAEGSIQKRTYEDKEGNKRYTTEIMVEKITFLQTNKKEKIEENEFENASIKTNQTQQFEITDDDLPF
jgi:single-strand DNA-binding protein